MRRASAKPAVGIVVLLAALTAGDLRQATPAHAQAGPTPRCSKDFCVEDEQRTSDEPAVEAMPVSASRAPAECVWRQDPPPGFDPTTGPSTFFELEGEQTATAYVVYEFCGDRFSGRMRWVTPSAPEPLPTPGELAQTVYVRLEGDLPTPAVAADPTPGEAAIVSVPTFVEVANWTGTVSARACDPTGALCVAVTATPALSFVPGEPGAPVVECAGAGTRFVAGGPASSAQASRPGACSYAYRLRTGVGSRPAAWPGEVTVTWALTWTSTSGESGALPDVVKSAVIGREVHEVQTVIER